MHRAIACLLLVLLSGCGLFETRIAPQGLDEVYREGYRDGIRVGMRLGARACVHAVRKEIEHDVELLSAIRTYQRLVRAGVLAPPRIALVRRAPAVRKGGRVYEGASFKVVIVDPPRFVRRSFFDRLLDPGRFYTVGVFENRLLANRYAKRLRADAVAEPDEVWVMATDDGRYAVVIRSLSGKDYSALGMAEGVPQRPEDLSGRVPPVEFRGL